MRWTSLLVVAGVAFLVPEQAAKACSCGGAPSVQWPETELPADQALAMGSCWGDSGLELHRVFIDDVAAGFVVDEALTGDGFLGVRIEPPPMPGQQVLIETCNADCGEPGDWYETLTLEVVDPLNLSAPDAILDGTLNHAEGEFQPGCEIAGFRVSLDFDVAPVANVFYRIEIGEDGEPPLFTKYDRVIEADEGEMAERTVAQHLQDAAALGFPPEDLCATVSVIDFGGGESAPVKICGSTESDPGDGDGDGDGDGTGDGDSGGPGANDDAEGCACGVTNGSAGGWWLLSLLGLGRRRRPGTRERRATGDDPPGRLAP